MLIPLDRYRPGKCRLGRGLVASLFLPNKTEALPLCLQSKRLLSFSLPVLHPA